MSIPVRDEKWTAWSGIGGRHAPELVDDMTPESVADIKSESVVAMLRSTQN